MDIENISIEKDDDIIFITVAKYKLFLSYGKIGMDAYMLYSHLMFTARLQETNQVKAKDIYIRQGLEWGSDRLLKTKNLLIDLGLIELIQKRDEQGKFENAYIKIHAKKTPFEIEDITRNTPNPRTDKPVSGQTRERVPGTKCLNEKDKCLNEKDKCLNEKDKIEDLNKIPISDNFNSLIETYREIIEYWNTYKFFTTHTIKENKTIKEIIKLLRIITSGISIDQIHIDKKYLKKHKIPIDLLSKKVSIESIKKAIDAHAAMFAPDVFPADKKNLAKHLLTFLFNENTKTSAFYKCLANGKPIPFHVPYIDRDLLKIYKKIGQMPSGEATDRELRYVIKDILAEHKKICERVGIYEIGYTTFRQQVGDIKDPSPFLENHAEWLDETYGDRFTLGMMKPHTRAWERFVHHLETFHEIGLYLDDDEIEMRKKEYERELKEIEDKKNEEREIPSSEIYGIGAEVM